MTTGNCVKAVVQMTHLVINDGPFLPETRRPTAKLEWQQPLQRSRLSRKPRQGGVRRKPDADPTPDCVNASGRKRAVTQTT
jgi:hypothetical protein